MVQRALERRDLRILLIAAYVSVTCLLVAHAAWVLVPYGDWNVWVQLPGRLSAGTLYAHSDTYTWAWSPLAALLMANVVLPIGPWAWGALHLAALRLFGDWRMVLLVASAYPFWLDTLLANTFVFVAGLGFAAWRGSRWAALGYLALLILMPRPVQLPLAALLLWRDRSLWLPFAVMVAVGFVTTIGSGYLADWLRVLVAVGGRYPSQEFNLSPTRVVGLAWLVIAIPLAIALTLRRHPGWAGLVVSPYVVPQYLLLLVIEIRPGILRGRHRVPASRDRTRGEVAADRAGQYGSP